MATTRDAQINRGISRNRDIFYLWLKFLKKNVAAKTVPTAKTKRFK